MKLIAIIDDGLQYNKLHLKVPVIEYEINNKNKIVRTLASKQRVEGHGMICANIIEELVEVNDYIIISIKVKDNASTSGRIEKLIKAIKFCVLLHVDIINISIGTCEKYKTQHLHRVVKKAYENGIVIVSAISNDNRITYPAAFKEVLAVKANIRGLGNRVICFRDLKYGEFFATWISNEILTDNGEKINFRVSNSYAAPAIVANIVNHLFIGEYQKTLDDFRNRIYVTIG